MSRITFHLTFHHIYKADGYSVPLNAESHQPSLLLWELPLLSSIEGVLRDVYGVKVQAFIQEKSLVVRMLEAVSIKTGSYTNDKGILNLITRLQACGGKVEWYSVAKQQVRFAMDDGFFVHHTPFPTTIEISDGVVSIANFKWKIRFHSYRIFYVAEGNQITSLLVRAHSYKNAIGVAKMKASINEEDIIVVRLCLSLPRKSQSFF